MVLEVLTGMLAVITAFYAWATFRILKANEKIVEVARQEAENIARPYVVIRSFTVPDNTIVFLDVTNTGKTAAYNLRLQLDKDFFQFGERKEQRNLREMELFCREFECFPPNSRLVFYLGVGATIFVESADPEVTPTVFIVTATRTGPRFSDRRPSGTSAL